MIKIDNSKFKDEGGRYVTQSLFLEYQYNTNLAVYTLDDEDKEYKGKIYPSLKKRYLECEDPTEYTFAKAHLAGWGHWQRLIKNKWLNTHIELWREELEVYMASTGIQAILDLTEAGNFQAAKFVADRQWNKKRGRPSKEEQERKSRIDERIADEFAEDAERVNNVTSIR